jgi:putative transposase
MVASLRGYRYLLSLTGEQERELTRWAGCCRWVFNQALAAREAAYQATGEAPGYAALCKLLTAWKRENDWLRLPPAMVLQQALKDLDAGYQRFFAGQNARPRFRSRHHWPLSIRIPQDKNTLRVERLSGSVGWLNLPKLGWVRFRWSRPPEGVIRSVTLSRDACGDWWVSILCQLPGEVAPQPTVVDAEQVRGLDLGVAQSVTPDEGPPGQLPTPSAGDRRHAAKLARRVSRKRKGSKNRAKAQKKLNTFRRRWRRRRVDAQHKLSNRLIRENQAIIVEDLKINSMTRRARGARVRQKAGLNRSILSQGWGGFRALLEWKGRSVGTLVERVNPAHTSQRCSSCGVLDAASRLSQAVFACTGCGHAENADVNAAKNIRAAGLSSLKARGVHVRPGRLRSAGQRAKKREPIGNQLELPWGV